MAAFDNTRTASAVLVAPKPADLKNAVNQLCESERGRDALRSILKILDGDALDVLNQQAVLILLRGGWGSYAGSARVLIREALGRDDRNCSLPKRNVSAAAS